MPELLPWEKVGPDYKKVRKSAPEVGIDSKSKSVQDADIPSKLWWSKEKNGIGGGVHINDALPINPCPLTGGQNWYDNVCSIKKV